MDVVREKVAALGLDRDTLRIEGVRSLRFKETRTTVSGHEADEYEAYCSRLVLRSPDAEFVLEPGSAEFKALERALAHHRLPLYATLVEAGATAPDNAASFAFSFAVIDDFKRIDDEWFDALLSGDEAKTYEMEWQRFHFSAAFKKTPCDRETYDMLRTALADGGHLRTMDFGQYYDWYVKSSVKVDAEGAPTPEAAAEAERIVDAWLTGTMDAKQMKYWLCRNLSIHPVHRSGFEAMVDEKTSTPRPAATAPRI